MVYWALILYSFSVTLNDPNYRTQNNAILRYSITKMRQWFFVGTVYGRRNMRSKGGGL
jgi:hypothetical protein